MVNTTAFNRVRNVAHQVVPQPTANLAEEDQRAQNYYDSEDAFNFYTMVWGGDNLHVGIYGSDTAKVPLGPERIKVASESSLNHLLAKRPPPRGGRVMDMGSAYGGCARAFASKYDCHVFCCNISEKENERNRQMTKAAGMEHLLTIPGATSFTDTKEPSQYYDLVVSEDSLLHAGQHRKRAIAEAARLLKPGGFLVFTDIMQSDDCDVSQMAPVYKRIQLDDMGSPATYRKWAEAAGLKFIEFEDKTDVSIADHYGTTRKVLLAKNAAGELRGKISDEYIANMSNGLQSWVDQAGAGNLKWGYMVFQKH